MDITDVHELTYENHTHTYLLLSWSCSCGAFWHGPYYRSKVLARIGYEETHRYPTSPPREHTYVATVGEFGGPGWGCSCGHRGRPEGYTDTRRAEQAFATHVNRWKVKWYDAVHDQTLKRMKPLDRASREAILRWHAKPADVREEQAAYFLSNIL